MTASKRKRWDQFQGFIASPSSEEPPASLRDELESLGVDVERVDLAVSQIVSLGRSKARNAWLTRARRAQAAFDATVESKKSWVSRRFNGTREILSAIASGSLGAGVQQQALVFFRNRDLNQASEADLRSFLDDCELLGLLKNKDGEKA